MVGSKGEGLGDLGNAGHGQVVTESDAPGPALIEWQAVAGQGPVNRADAGLDHRRADLWQGRVYVVNARMADLVAAGDVGD